MSLRHPRRSVFGSVAVLVSLAVSLGLPAAPLHAQTSKTYEPSYGQEGKDVIWVPTQPLTIERMLRMAQVTSRDTVVDLGSGDGRIAIAAVKDFGAKAFGFEYPGHGRIQQTGGRKSRCGRQGGISQSGYF